MTSKETLLRTLEEAEDELLSEHEYARIKKEVRVAEAILEDVAAIARIMTRVQERK